MYKRQPQDDTVTAVFYAKSSPIVEQSEAFTIIIVAGILLILGYFTGMLSTKHEQENTEAMPTKEGSTPDVASTHVEPIDEVEASEDTDEFSFEPIENTLIEVIESPVELTEESTEIIDIDEEADVSASGRLASLRDEIESGERKPETREERMRRLFGDK